MGGNIKSSLRRWLEIATVCEGGLWQTAEGYWFEVLFLDGLRETKKIVAIDLHFFLTILIIFLNWN
jgi:hypothetical protein